MIQTSDAEASSAGQHDSKSMRDRKQFDDYRIWGFEKVLTAI